METKRIHYSEITSTNEYAKELIVDFDNLIITADYQTAGKGRNDKNWLGNFGSNVYYTYAINHKSVKPLKNKSYYQIIGALAVFDVLSEYLPFDNIRLKYPNDIYVMTNENTLNKFQKISGILSEHSYIGGDLITTVLGIGINVNQTKFDISLSNNATSISNLGFNVEVEDVINLLTLKLENLLMLDEFKIFERWKSLINLENKEIIVFNKTGIFALNKILEDCRLELFNIDTKHIEIIDNGDSIRYNLN